MADICIVYADEDRAITEKLHGLLSDHWGIWWDDNIVGEYPQVIEEEISKAICLVPLFSAFSRKKGTVIDELNFAKNLGKHIIPIKLDDSIAPMGFGTYSRIDMRGWNGEANHPGFLQLKRKLARIVPPTEKPKRPPFIASVGIPLPTLFLSVSSHETQLVPADAVRALRVFGAPTILVSAYDLVTRYRCKPQGLIDELKEYQGNGGFILIDSGNYEKSRLGSKRWKSANLKDALAQSPHDWAFCFDVMKPKHNPDRAIDEIVCAVERDRDYTKAQVLPIVHAPKLKHGGYKLEHIPQIFREVSEKLGPPLIAIPERELGAGLIARAKTVQRIREELNKLPFYQPIHILGTGNPWSMAVLTAAGADTFDGLEWCRMVIDHSKHRLHHIQHFDFFMYQTRCAESPITTAALEDPKIDFAGKVAFHNLDYYASFVRDMREYVKKDNMEAFVIGLTGPDTAKQLKQQVPGLFK